MCIFHPHPGGTQATSTSMPLVSNPLLPQPLPPAAWSIQITTYFRSLAPQTQSRVCFTIADISPHSTPWSSVFVRDTSCCLSCIFYVSRTSCVLHTTRRFFISQVNLNELHILTLLGGGFCIRLLVYLFIYHSCPGFKQNGICCTSQQGSYPSCNKHDVFAGDVIFSIHYIIVVVLI